MFETAVRDGVLQVRAPETRWLLTGWNGGYTDSDAVYNITVPDGWDRTDLTRYTTDRRREAGFETGGPALLTGVDMAHAAGAECEGVRGIATVGLSNPAALPLEPGGAGPGEREQRPEPGTINVLVGTDRALEDGALATLLATVVEAKTATIQSRTGFTGTTSDAVAVGTDPGGELDRFAGSATAVGDATRSVVRRAIHDSLDSRERPPPESVEAADSGIVTNRDARPFDP
ncbi:MAG: adenosylcobinamide amidohydrolase [Halodesulfurarchaeum sp.]